MNSYLFFIKENRHIIKDKGINFKDSALFLNKMWKELPIKEK